MATELFNARERVNFSNHILVGSEKLSMVLGCYMIKTNMFCIFGCILMSHYFTTYLFKTSC